MIQFTRTHQTGGLHIAPEHTSETETITFAFKYPDRHFTIGSERYSLTICPHFGRTDNWRIEGLRGDDHNVIWYTGTFDGCIEKFKRIEQAIHKAGHQIAEPDGFDMEQAFRAFYKHILDLPRWHTT